MKIWKSLLVVGLAITTAVLVKSIFATDRPTSVTATPSEAEVERELAATPMMPLFAAAGAEDGVASEPGRLAADVTTDPPLSLGSLAAAERVSTLIRGTARTSSGVPIDPYDVTIRIGDTTSTPSTSDGQGRFAFRFDELREAEEGEALLQFRACGFALLEHWLQLRGGQEVEVEVVLQPAGDLLSGTVTDMLGQPLLGARVRVHSRNVFFPVETVHTNAEGRFTVRCLRNEDVVAMEFVRSGYVEHRLEAGEVGHQWDDLQVALADE